jgi:phosphatidylserine/phosphatidylglycerophosphate/cardiolipin synthase-like enzyme
MSGLEFRFLQDGAQSPADVAAELVAFLDTARESLDVAIYDFEARTGATAAVADALEAAAGRGVRVRVVFNVERPRGASDPRPPVCEPAVVDGLEVPTRGVSGNGALMHHKYVVRDAAEVWTGSTNWTQDAFGREENVVVRLASGEIAAGFAANFQRLWDRERVDGSGAAGDETAVDGAPVRALFSPDGPSLGQAIANRIGEARRRIRIASPVLTSGPILGTLAELAGRHAFDLSGAYDETQMQEVRDQWARVPGNHWKIEAWDVIRPRLAGKRSTPYGNASVHDYMHAKITVADDEVLTGSYNASHGGEDNAENLVHIRSEAVAERFVEFVDGIVLRYGSTPAGPAGKPAGAS